MSDTMTKHSFKHLLTFLVILAFPVAMFAQPAIKVTLNTPANTGNMSESCGGPYELIIERDPSNSDTVFITLEALGVAQNGIDYNFPPGTFPITLLPTQSILVIPISIVNDGPEGTESIIWNLNYKAGPLVKTITINSSIVDDYDVQIVSATDTIKWCRYAPFTLQANSASQIQWSPSPAFDPSTGGQVTVRPFVSGWYYANVGTDTCGATDSVYFDLAIANIDADTIFICKEGNGATLNGQLLGLATGFEWIPSDSTLSDTNSLTPIANPEITTTYILQSDFGVCVASDTVVVRVDSLPQDLHIDVAPVKPYYCEGEMAALFSPAYDSLLFPDLTFNWTPFDNSFNSEQDLLNAALTLLDTTTYIRENINNACSSFDSITLNVVPSGVPLSLTDTTLCPGQQFQVMVLSNQVTEPEWTPATGLSCTECLNPTVTVTGLPGETVVYMFSGKILECPVGANLIVTIPPPATINITSSQQTVCNGDVVTLNITNANLSQFAWQITEGSASLSCTNCPNPTVTVQGDQSVSLTVNAESTDPNFCGAFGFIQLVHGPPAAVSITASDLIVCQGDVVSLGVIDPNNFSGLHWNVDGGSASLSCTDCLNPDVTITGENPVTISISGQSNLTGFCGAFGQIVIDQGATIQPAQFEIQVCDDSTVQVMLTDPHLTAYHWELFGTGGVSLSCNDCESPIVTVESAGSIRYFATANYADTCKAVGIISFTLFDAESTILEASPNDTVAQGEEAMVMLSVSGGTPTNIQWTVNGIEVGGTDTKITFDADEEENLVVVSFINSNGCPQSDTIIVYTRPPMYTIPNAFTPGSDGMNDKFRVVVEGNIRIGSFKVFNRWGQMVYEGPEDDMEGWDGNFKGKQAVSDTYVYVAELFYPDGRREVAKGDVILIR